MLSIVIVNWNTRQLLADCLRSVFAQAPGLPLEVIVVDNGSTDGSPALVRSEFPQVTLIENSENIGYARATNQGLAACSGEYILLLNSDTRLLDHTLRTMVNFLAEEPRAGALGAGLILPDGQLQHSAAGYDFSLRAAFNQYLFLSALFPRQPVFQGYYVHLKDTHAGPVEVDWVSGACLLARAQALAEVGPLDESFFMYMEDVEWCNRLRAAGWKVFYLPTATVEHRYGGSISQPGQAITLWLGAVDVFFRQRYGPVRTLTLHLLESIGFALRLLFAIPGAVRDRPGARARLQTMAAGLTASLRLLLDSVIANEPRRHMACVSALTRTC